MRGTTPLFADFSPARRGPIRAGVCFDVCHVVPARGRLEISQATLASTFSIDIVERTSDRQIFAYSIGLSPLYEMNPGS